MGRNLVLTISERSRLYFFLDRNVVSDPRRPATITSGLEIVACARARVEPARVRAGALELAAFCRKSLSAQLSGFESAAETEAGSTNQARATP